MFLFFKYFRRHFDLVLIFFFKYTNKHVCGKRQLPSDIKKQHPATETFEFNFLHNVPEKLAHVLKKPVSE